MSKYFIIAIAFLCSTIYIAAVLAQDKSTVWPALRSPPATAEGAGGLQGAIKKKDIKAVNQEVDKLGQQNDISAFTALSDTLVTLGAQPDIEIYWTIICGMASFTNADVTPKMADFIIKHKDDRLGKSLLVALRSNQSKEKSIVLNSIKDKVDPTMQDECIRQLDNKQTKIIDKDAKSIKSYRDLKIVQELDKDKIIVVRNDGDDPYNAQAGGKDRKGEPLFDGNFDRIEDVLTELGIPHTLIGKSELEKDSFDWDSKWIIIFNCNFFKDHCVNPEHLKMMSRRKKGAVECTSVCPGADNHLVKNFKLSDKAIKKIRQFVEEGGFLFTEDFNIEEILWRAFKGYIIHTKFLPEQTVKILPNPDAALHPYLKYVFETPPMQLPDSSGMTKTLVPESFNTEAQWKIDDDSPDLKILKKDKVTILISSPNLAKSQRSEGAMAVTFSVGSDAAENRLGGQVLHIMTHIAKFCPYEVTGQKSNIDEFTVQNLLVNYLEDCARHHSQPDKKQSEPGK
jgi:hypothetical protein